MKTTALIIAVAGSLSLFSCSTSKTNTTATTVTTESENAAKDQIEYYETDFEIRQKDYLDQLAGNWDINTMQRQAMIPVENLSNISIRLNADRTFQAGLHCGQVTGTYSLKGTSIKFSTEGASACSNDAQMVELVRLLTQNVSAYSVDNRTLLLRDGSANIIFRAAKSY